MTDQPGPTTHYGVTETNILLLRWRHSNPDERHKLLPVLRARRLAYRTELSRIHDLLLNRTLSPLTHRFTAGYADRLNRLIDALTPPYDPLLTLPAG